MKHLKPCGAALVGAFVAAFAWTLSFGENKHGFVHRVFRDGAGEEFKYVLFVPHGYGGSEQGRFPLIVFLHGSGASGSDGEKHVASGLAATIRDREKDFTFLALFPQSHEGTWDADSADGQRVMSILAEVEAEYRVDPSRVYLTGYSLGGYGTWSLAARHPDKWAAIIPVCGGGNPDDAAKIKTIPCWCFHGDADQIVPLHASQAMIASLRREGSTPQFTVYAHVGHSIAERVYGDPHLYEWLNRQKK